MVHELVAQARRRLWWNEIVAQSAWSINAAMGAVVLLLLLGTEILDWHWLVLLPLATLGIGTYRTIKRLPSAYAVAQKIDARLGLADSLSTALFFDTCPGWASESMRDAQRREAERIAATVSVRQAIPFTMPRAVYAMTLLFLAAGSLFALRYGLERRLNLDKPIARILQRALGLEQAEAATLEKKKDPAPKKPRPREIAGLTMPENGQPTPAQLKGEPDSALDAEGAPEPAKADPKGGEAQQSKPAAGPGEEGEDPEGESGESAGLSTGNQDGSDGQPGQSLQNQAGRQPAESQSPGSPGSNSSLMSKFRDAMANLMSRMRQQPSGGSGTQVQSKGQNGREGAPQPGNNGQGKSSQQQQGGQQGQGQEGEGQEAQAAQNATGRGSGKGSQEQSSQQPGSGIGRQDGAKDLKMAEQLAAMGKLSEIIGKRSANVSGEVTVEVQSNNQQLQTPYSQRAARHGESAAEISRDEVPVALQAYVQQYFEQVRKQAAPRTRN